MFLSDHFNFSCSSKIKRIIPLFLEYLLPRILELTSDHQKWRFRLSIIRHIPLLARKLGQDNFNKYLATKSISYLTDKVFAIRDKASENLQEIIQIFGFPWFKEFLYPKLLDLKAGKSYLNRLTYLFTIRKLMLLSDIITSDFVTENILPSLFQLAQDNVANVRFNVAITLQCIKEFDLIDIKDAYFQGSEVDSESMEDDLTSTSTLSDHNNNDLENFPDLEELLRPVKKEDNQLSKEDEEKPLPLPVLKGAGRDNPQIHNYLRSTLEAPVEEIHHHRSTNNFMISKPLNNNNNINNNNHNSINQENDPNQNQNLDHNLQARLSAPGYKLKLPKQKFLCLKNISDDNQKLALINSIHRCLFHMVQDDEDPDVRYYAREALVAYGFAISPENNGMADRLIMGKVERRIMDIKI